MTDIASGRLAPPTALARATLFFVYLLPLAALVYWRPMMYFFEESKGFYVVGIADVLFLLLALRFFAAPNTLPRAGRVGWALIALVGTLFLASLFGVNFSTSFWGEADRVTSLFYWAHLLIIFFALQTALQTKQQWYRFLTFSVCIALVVAFLQMLHLLDVSTILASRNGATIGNSNYLSVYLLFHVFFALFLAVSHTTRNRKIFGIAAAAFLGAVLVAPNEAHAATIVLFGSLALLIALGLAMAGHTTWRRTAGWVLLTLMVVGAISSTLMLANPQSRLRAYMTQASSGSRFVLWDIAWQGIKERPILGWGLELYPAVFYRYYDPCFGADPCGAERYFDRAHNKLLDVWVESGIVGVVAYAVLFLVAIRTLWGLRKKRDEVLPAAVLLALLGGYLVQSLVSLDVAITLLFFIITLALIQSLNPTSRWTGMPPAHVRSAVLFIAPILFVAGFLVFVVQPVRASNAAERHKEATSMAEEITWYEIAQDASSYGQRLRATHIAFDVLVWLNTEGASVAESNPAFVQEATKRAQRTIEQQITRTGFDPRLYSLLGSLYQMEGRFFDAQVYEQARRILQEGMSKHPINPMPHWAMVSVLLEVGEIQPARDLTEKILQRAPNNPEAQYNRSIVEKFVSGAAALDREERFELLNLAGRF